MTTTRSRGAATCLAALSVSAVTALAPSAPAAAQTPEPATVTVVHGVRGLVVDVQVDGKTVLAGFAPERVTEPLTLPAGPHRVQIRPTGAAATSAPVVDVEVQLAPGARNSAAVGVGPGGRPRVQLYDDSRLAASGATALVGRSLTPATDAQLLVDGAPKGQVQGAGERVVPVAAGQRSVELRSANAALVPAQDVPVASGRTTALYLIGTPGQGGFGLIAQTLRPTGRAVPTVVDSGEGPLPSAPRTAPPLLAGLAALAVLLAAPAVRRRARR